MFFINNSQIDLSLLNPAAPTGGNKYRGTDEILSKIARKWQELYDRYKYDEPIFFIRPHMKSGFGEGSRGGSYLRSVVIQTNNGTKRLTWADTAIEIGKDTYNFLPRRFTHTPNEPIVLTLQKDIEQILWHCLYDGLKDRSFTYPVKDTTGKPHPKAGKTVPGIFILDPNDEASEFLKQGEKSAPMWYFIMSKTSPIANDRNKINLLASAWGVSKPEALSENIAKQLLVQAIEAAEAKNDKDYGYFAFTEAVSNIMESGDTTNIEMLALISRAVDRGILKYMPSKLAWFLVGENGVEIKRLCQVSTVNDKKSKEVLVAHLLKNDDDITLIQGSVEAKPIKEKSAKKVYIPKNPTAEFFEKTMKFNKMKNTCTIIGVQHYEKKKEDLIKILIDYFVTQGKTIPEENLLEEPEDE
jgi:hypothetical protein